MRPNQLGIPAILIVIFLFLVPNEKAEAGIITFNYSGTVTSVDFLGGSPTEFGVGDIVSGSYSFDSAAPADPIPPVLSRYDSEALELQVGTTTAFATNGDIFVLDAGIEDTYFISYSSVIGASVPGSDVIVFSFFLEGNLFTSQDLPLTPPDLGSATNSRMTISFLDSNRVVGRALASLDSITLQEPGSTQGVVPEPASLAIFGTGALGLIGFGRRRKQAPSA